MPATATAQPRDLRSPLLPRHLRSPPRLSVRRRAPKDVASRDRFHTPRRDEPKADVKMRQGHIFFPDGARHRLRQTGRRTCRCSAKASRTRSARLFGAQHAERRERKTVKNLKVDAPNGRAEVKWVAHESRDWVSLQQEEGEKEHEHEHEQEQEQDAGDGDRAAARPSPAPPTPAHLRSPPHASRDRFHTPSRAGETAFIRRAEPEANVSGCATSKDGGGTTMSAQVLRLAAGVQAETSKADGKSRTSIGRGAVLELQRRGGR
jgi:hypothetical protein